MPRTLSHTQFATTTSKSPTYNPLDGKVVDLLACVCPEKFPIVSADLFENKKKKRSLLHFGLARRLVGQKRLGEEAGEHKQHT